MIRFLLRTRKTALGAAFRSFRVRRLSFRAPRSALIVLLLLLLAAGALALKRCPSCGKTYEDVENYCADCTDSAGKPVRLEQVETGKPKPTPSGVRGDVAVHGDTLVITSTPPGAAIKLDDYYVGNTPDRVVGTSIGRHTVRLSLPGHSSYSVEVEVKAPVAPSGMRPLGLNSQGYEEFLWLKDSSVMIRVPAGTFTMGSNEIARFSGPEHSVYLDEFCIDKYEVTNRQYRRFCDATHRPYPGDPDFLGLSNYIVSCPSYPVLNLSWADAKAYCDWVGKRLPTEAEWEKAARGTDARKYPWGNAEPDAEGLYRANYGAREGWAKDGYEGTAPVGSFESGASPYGCMDMAGNVADWCSDWHGKDYYFSSPKNNPQGPSSGTHRVIRGGSWEDWASELPTWNHQGYPPTWLEHDQGFRCAVTPE